MIPSHRNSPIILRDLGATPGHSGARFALTQMSIKKTGRKRGVEWAAQRKDARRLQRRSSIDVLSLDAGGSICCGAVYIPEMGARGLRCTFEAWTDSRKGTINGRILHCNQAYVSRANFFISASAMSPAPYSPRETTSLLLS